MKFTTVLLLIVGISVFSSGEVTPSLPWNLAHKVGISDSQNLSYEVNTEQLRRKRSSCSVSIRQLANNHPLFLVPCGTKFWPFSKIGTMDFKAGEMVELFCTKMYSKPSGHRERRIASCVSGTTFSIEGVNYNLNEVACNEWPVPTAERTNVGCNGGMIYRIGFKVETRFVEQLKICFNAERQATRYVYHTLAPGSNYYYNKEIRPFFSDMLLHRNTDSHYKQNIQLQTINKALGGVGGRYIISSSTKFLSRGHMAAKADFMYGPQQFGTFFLLNTAPQWQSFNGGNWNKVEELTRAWVSNQAKNVECYTGVYGVTTLPNANGVQTPLYLNYDASGKGLIPVPMLYFRVIIEPSSKRGVVIIGVNNPYLTLQQIQREYILCRDVSSRISWLTLNKHDIQAGYIYACEVAEFKQKNSNLPNFNVRSLLN